MRVALGSEYPRLDPKTAYCATLQNPHCLASRQHARFLSSCGLQRCGNGWQAPLRVLTLEDVSCRVRHPPLRAPEDWDSSLQGVSLQLPSPGFWNRTVPFTSSQSACIASYMVGCKTTDVCALMAHILAGPIKSASDLNACSSFDFLCYKKARWQRIQCSSGITTSNRHEALPN